jgi:hypothetical protein
MVLLVCRFQHAGPRRTIQAARHHSDVNRLPVIQLSIRFIHGCHMAVNALVAGVQHWCRFQIVIETFIQSVGCIDVAGLMTDSLTRPRMLSGMIPAEYATGQHEPHKTDLPADVAQRVSRAFCKRSLAVAS